jgi:hypothetical protein
MPDDVGYFMPETTVDNSGFGFRKKWHQTVMDVWRTLNCTGGCFSEERYVITLNKGL